MPTDVTVAQRSRPPQPTVWLEITYLGTDPPTALFDDLEMIGWRPPVPASPPAWAIDWSTPDPATGQRFSIREWTVEAAVAEPPQGSGTRGHWTQSERDLFLVSLEGVLRRHGLLEATDAQPGPAGAGTALPPPPDPPAVPSAAPTAPTGGPTAVVRAAIAPEAQRDRVAAALEPLPVTSHIERAVRSVASTYRGATFERRTEVLEVEVLCERPMVEVVQAVLRDLGLAPSLHDAPTTAPLVALVAAGDPGRSTPDVGAEPDVDVDLRSELAAGRAVVVVVVDPTHEDRASALLARHAAGPVRTAPTTVTVTNAYRGTTFETQRPAVRVSCPTPAEDADESAAAAAGALGLALDDRRRVRVLRPEDGRASDLAVPDGLEDHAATSG